MSKITYLNGDATNPLKTDNESRIICHVCNDKGGWGRGFVLALSKRWKEPEEYYRDWAKQKEEGWPDMQLGKIQLIEVETNLFVANMIAQHDVRWVGDIPPVRYDRVRQCLNKVAVMAKSLDASVHMPRIASGLAGGTWQVVEGLIKETLIAKDIDVFVYDLKE